MALSTSLIAYWPLDEASGSAIDAHGNNDLTETSGTIASIAGKVGNARDFEAADTEYFEIADNADLSAGDTDFTFAGWVNAESLSNFPVILRKGPSGSTREYVLYYNTGVSPNRLQFDVFSSGGVQGQVNGVPPNSASWSTATWYFVVVWHDSVNNVLGMSVNDETAITAAHTVGVRDDTGTFQLGAGSDQSLWWDGILDDWGFWRRVLTSAERTELYNSGTGRDYSYIVGASGSPFSLVAANGSFTHTGQNASLVIAGRTTGDLGTFTFTGRDVGLNYSAGGAKTLVSSQGSFSFTGQEIGFDYAVPFSELQYTLTGQNVTLTVTLAAKILTAAHGSFTHTGQTAGLAFNHGTTGALGSYTLTRVNATLTYSGGAAPSVAPKNQRINISRLRIGL